MIRASLLGMSLALMIAACEQGPGAPIACTRELGISLTPRDTAVAVGSAFTPAIVLYSCGGRVRFADVYTWTSDDPSVARVHSETGRVAAIGAGETRIHVEGAFYGRLGVVRITVTE